jgi:hypothetical protein
MKRKIIAVVSLAALLAALGACSTISDPDKVGLYYDKGNSDGYHFDKCIDPGTTGDAEWNNEVIYLPTSLRTWNIAPEHGDDNKAITVATKPEPNQPSGVQVNVWVTTNFFLNTFCDNNGGVVKDFWEKIGRRYAADGDDGWKAMLFATFEPVLAKTIQDRIRAYGADELVGNVGGVREKAQEEIAAEFTEELKRTVGGPYFCGPTFNRAKADCPPVELLIRDIDYTDGGIQDARNAKQKAIEQAAANVAAAQGEVDAAKKRGELYNNPAWVKLQLAQAQLEAIKACSANPNCTIIIGADGNVLLNQK